MIRLAGAFIAALFLLSGCATVPHFRGVGKIREYTIANGQVPVAFDGFRIAFATDFHYASKYKAKQLDNTVRALQYIAPDLLLLGGDYQEGCDYVKSLFAALAEVKPPYGIAGVLGNNDYERCTEEIQIGRAHV